VVVLIFLSGLMFTWFGWNSVSRKLADDALEQARLVAMSINTKRLLNLKGDKSDLVSPDYVRIKEQLFRIRRSHGTCRFLYLMGRKKDGTVFFFVDCQPAGSRDYAPPGLVYEEVSKEYIHTFNTGKEQTVGPITDRWGTLVSSLVPIYNEKQDRMIAVLGMDIDADQWNRIILLQSSITIALTVLATILAIFLFIIIRNRQLLKKRFIEKEKIASELQESLVHVKKLQGILPICSKCKKIRDDRGYWNQIEEYIYDHSEADFSHGLCPDCAEELYGDKEWYKKKT